ncbi:hypothetical protein JCM10207_004587 [Rhodosporidiobolus poonsookiae]
MSVPPVHAPLDTGPRHPNDAAPGRISKGGSLLTGGYLAHKIYVGNLPDSATLADLEDCFGQIGPCTCVLKRGFGFVEYTDGSHAAEAVAKYNEGHFLGSQIKVELSLARAPGNAKEVSRGPGPGQEKFPPGSDRPSDPRKPMWINGRGGRGRGGPDSRDRFNGPPGYNGGGYGPRYDERPPIDRPGWGPPRGSFDGYGPPRGGDFRGPPPPGYGPPIDRPPYDPYYNRAPDYAYPPPGAPGAAPGYPGAAPYDRPPYPGAAPPPAAGAAARDPYADRYPPANRSPVVPPPDAARAPYAAPSLDPYARPGQPPVDGPPSGYDPRDERGAGARYQPYPSRDERTPRDGSYGGRSPARGSAPLERRRSLSPRRGGPPADPYRDSFPPAANGYPPYDARAPPPPAAGGYGAPPFDRSRSPPRYPPRDESYRP